MLILYMVITGHRTAKANQVIRNKEANVYMMLTGIAVASLVIDSYTKLTRRA